MTIPAGQSGVTYHTGNGTASTFDYEFKITAEADLKVTQTDTAGVDTVLVLNTDYTVTGVGNNAGGSITLVAGALASNYTLAIEDDVEVSQLTPFGNQSAFYANLHEDAYDKNTRIARKSIYELDRVLKIPASVQGVNTELPKPEGLNLFRWNEDGTALENVETADLITTAQFSNFKTDTFVDGIDFTAGTTTTVTLDSAPGTKANTQVYFDGVYQEKSEYSLAATVITFDTPIPIGVGAVEVVYGKAADVLAPSTREVKIADGVATAYTLSNSYEPGNGTLHVYINGVRQEVGYGYAETNDSTVTFDSAPANGDRLLFLVNPYAPQTTADANNVTYTHPASGAVATNVGARLSQTVSVKDFGAVGDGVTDDTNAFILALSQGGAIHVPKGTYILSDSAFITTSNTSLVGTGKQSIIKMTVLDQPAIVIGDPADSGNAPSDVSIEGINFVQTQTQIDINGTGLFGLDQYKSAAAILHGRGNKFSVKNCTFYNFVNGISYYANADNQGAATANGFYVHNCEFDKCNFGMWIDGANNVEISDIIGNDTQYVQISGGTLLPPHLIYNISIDLQQTNWAINNIIDIDNPESSSVKLKYVDNITISNVITSASSTSVELLRCNNFTVSNVTVDETLENSALTFSTGVIRLIGCTNGSINNVFAKVTDSQHVIFLDELPAADYAGVVDIQTEDIVINNLVVDYQPSPNTPYSIVRMEETNKVSIVNPVIKRQTGHNIYLFYCDYTDTAGTDNIVINPVVHADSGDTYKHQIFFSEAGITNSKLVVNEALLNQSSIADAVANSEVSVYWTPKQNSYGMLDVALASSGRAWSPFTSSHAAIFENSGDTIVDIVGGDTSNTILAFSDTSAYGRGTIDYDHNTNSMTLRTNNSEKLFLNANTGSTGGTGSAGVGNQYVTLQIAGTNYKLLHDGTA